MSGASASAIARWLFEEHAARRPFRVHEALAGGDLDLACDAQDELIALRRAASGETIAGYKIGLTTPRMQRMCGLDHPIAGVILSGGVRRGPARIEAARFVRLGLECEVAARLARPLDGRGGVPAREEIAASIGEIAPAFEVIEDRAADYKALSIPGLVADNSWNAGMILGESRPLIDLSDRPGRLSINDAATDEGSTRDVLGHPLNSVAWLYEHLARRGRRIEAGQWVLTGSIVPTRFPAQGDRYRFAIDGLGEVTASVE